MFLQWLHYHNPLQSLPLCTCPSLPPTTCLSTACIVLSIMQSTHSITVTASTDESSVSDNTGAVVGGVVALVVVVVIAVTVVMVAYLVLQYRYKGKT